MEGIFVIYLIMNSPNNNKWKSILEKQLKKIFL